MNSWWLYLHPFLAVKRKISPNYIPNVLDYCGYWQTLHTSQFLFRTKRPNLVFSDSCYHVNLSVLLFTIHTDSYILELRPSWDHRHELQSGDDGRRCRMISPQKHLRGTDQCPWIEVWQSVESTAARRLEEPTGDKQWREHRATGWSAADQVRTVRGNGTGRDGCERSCPNRWSTDRWWMWRHTRRQVPCRS